jgi:hypothetical protein
MRNKRPSAADLVRDQMKWQSRVSAADRIRSVNEKIDRLKLDLRDAYQKYFRAGWDPTPDPYFLHDLHAKLADRIEARSYKIATCRSPKERERLERIEDRENAIAEFIWKRIGENQKKARTAK